MFVSVVERQRALLEDGCHHTVIWQRSVPVYRPKHTFDLKSSNFGYAGFQEKFDTPPLKPTNTEPSFRKLNSPPTKLRMLFPAHLQARELCPQTYSLSLPLEWSQVTHIPASIKSGGAYKPEKSAFYSTFCVCVDDVVRLGVEPWRGCKFLF